MKKNLIFVTGFWFDAAIFGLSGYCDGVEHAQISVLQKKAFDKPIVAALKSDMLIEFVFFWLTFVAYKACIAPWLDVIFDKHAARKESGH